MCCLEARIKCQLARLLISPVPSLVCPPHLWTAATEGIRLEKGPARDALLSLAGLQGQAWDRTHFTDEESAQGSRVPASCPRSRGGEPLLFLKCPAASRSLEYQRPLPGSSGSHQHREDFHSLQGRASAPGSAGAAAGAPAPVPASPLDACRAREPRRHTGGTPPGAPTSWLVEERDRPVSVWGERAPSWRSRLDRLRGPLPGGSLSTPTAELGKAPMRSDTPCQCLPAPPQHPHLHCRQGARPARVTQRRRSPFPRALPMPAQAGSLPAAIWALQPFPDFDPQGVS